MYKQNSFTLNIMHYYLKLKFCKIVTVPQLRDITLLMFAPFRIADRISLNNLSLKVHDQE